MIYNRCKKPTGDFFYVLSITTRKHPECSFQEGYDLGKYCQDCISNIEHTIAAAPIGIAPSMKY